MLVGVLGVVLQMLCDGGDKHVQGKGLISRTDDIPGIPSKRK